MKEVVEEEERTRGRREGADGNGNSRGGKRRRVKGSSRGRDGRQGEREDGDGREESE